MVMMIQPSQLNVLNVMMDILSIKTNATNALITVQIALTIYINVKHALMVIILRKIKINA